MTQVKRFQASKPLRLDCGHNVKEGDTVVMTTTFSCESDADWPLSVLRASFEAVLARFQREAKRSAPDQPKEEVK